MVRPIKQALNSIRIKYKLLILLVLPFTSFLVFAVYEVFDQYAEYETTRRIEHYHGRSSQLLDLLINLQKERGYTHAYAMTGDLHFKTGFINQRKLVDQAIVELDKTVAEAPAYIDSIDTQFEELLKHLHIVADIRAGVSLGLDPDSAWHYFSDTIHRITVIHRWLAIEHNDPQLINQYYAYLSLWDLMELAGWEQGRTFNLLDDRSSDGEAYREFNANAEQQRKAVQEIRQLAEFPGNERLFSVLKASAGSSPLNQMRERIHRKVDKGETAIDLFVHMGYGGLIHSFKNYLIRGSDEHLKEFHHHHGKALTILGDLKSLGGMTADELYDLEVIQDTLNSYNIVIEVVQHYRASGLSVADIDDLIQIDDSQAIEAAYRFLSPSQIDPHEWFEQATTRIDQIAVTTRLLGEEIHGKLKDVRNNAFQALIFWCIGTGLLVLASLALSIVVSRHFISRISALNRALRYIIESYDFTHRIPEGGEDEIGQTKQQFNRLIGHLQHQYEVEEQHRIQQQDLVDSLEAKQKIIDKDEELAMQVFDKVTQAGNNTNPNVHFWNKPMTGFSGDLVMSAESKTGFTYVMMCDFTGHGLPAALGAIPVSLVFYPMAKNDIGIPEIISEVNDKLLTLLPTAYFCCAAIMVLDRSRKSCIFWNGGLPPLLHYDVQGKLKASISGGHLPLGIAPYAMKDTIPQEILLDPGDSIYAYTDGLTEADNPRGEMFNETRLLSALSIPSSDGTRIPSVRSEVENFIEDAPASDDISIIELVA